MISRPLFIMVAESTEIFGPIFQVGWASGVLDGGARHPLGAPRSERARPKP
jgi:hypothetical protein